eukprot:TRINITY_DN18502_c0_g1_i1.p1 TRINITY_DN18502_c0_g1~~TRINITY_DN18502_c0_g1_i1.p1  ORF type:complete len:169 (+),score=18.98 TRINITY_DN18502_c0_g1_i1:37-507(+)
MTWSQANPDFHGRDLECGTTVAWSQDEMFNFMKYLPWEDPWAVMTIDVEDIVPKCRHGPMPFNPFPETQFSSSSIDAMVFWAQFSDWWLLPHLQRYTTIVHLLHLLATTPEEQWEDVSQDMTNFLRIQTFEVVRFWRALVLDVVNGNTQRWKPDYS